MQITTAIIAILLITTDEKEAASFEAAP